LLDHVGDVGLDEGEVLESHSEALVGRHVADRGIVVIRELLSVNRHGAGLTVGHASPLQNVVGILAR
jgi:DNA helicase TIP49 (TBP-interacting protein)